MTSTSWLTSRGWRSGNSGSACKDACNPETRREWRGSYGSRGRTLPQHEEDFRRSLAEFLEGGDFLRPLLLDDRVFPVPRGFLLDHNLAVLVPLRHAACLDGDELFLALVHELDESSYHAALIVVHGLFLLPVVPCNFLCDGRHFEPEYEVLVLKILADELYPACPYHIGVLEQGFQHLALIAKEVTCDSRAFESLLVSHEIQGARALRDSLHEF